MPLQESGKWLPGLIIAYVLPLVIFYSRGESYFYTITVRETTSVQLVVILLIAVSFYPAIICAVSGVRVSEDRMGKLEMKKAESDGIMLAVRKGDEEKRKTASCETNSGPLMRLSSLWKKKSECGNGAGAVVLGKYKEDNSKKVGEVEAGIIPCTGEYLCWVGRCVVI